jgi:uncharacterized protein GlcG (DUF336 family)
MESYASLKEFVALCEEVAIERGIPICVTVLDASALPVLLHRMQGTGVLNLEMAERKAYTSGAMGCESGSLADKIQPGQPLYSLTTSSSRLIAFGGGTQVSFGSESFGVGISGGPSDIEDMEILAEAQDRLKDSSAVWAPRWFTTSGR